MTKSAKNLDWFRPPSHIARPAATSHSPVPRFAWWKALHQHRLGTAPTAVLLRLAEWANADGTSVFPSAETLALTISLRPDSIAEWLRWSRAHGFIQLDSLATPGRAQRWALAAPYAAPDPYAPLPAGANLWVSLDAQDSLLRARARGEIPRGNPLVEVGENHPPTNPSRPVPNPRLASGHQRAPVADVTPYAGLALVDHVLLQAESKPSLAGRFSYFDETP